VLSPRTSRGREPRSKRWALALVFVLLTLSSIWRVRFQYARSLYQFVALPVRTPLLFVHGACQNVSDSFADRRHLQTEVERLVDELATAQRRLDELAEVNRQNERLAELLDFKQHERQTELTVAEVIGRDPNPMRRTLLIDKGAAAGISRDDPVMVPDGIVGRVVEVYRYSARVLLLQDKQSSIGAMIQRTRAMGDAMGQGNELLILRNLPPELPVETGDLVITSGMSTFYPKGLRIGVVAEHRQAPGRLVQDVSVRPSADAMRVEEVLVIRRLKPSIQKAAAATP